MKRSLSLYAYGYMKMQFPSLTYYIPMVDSHNGNTHLLRSCVYLFLYNARAITRPRARLCISYVYAKRNADRYAP